MNAPIHPPRHRYRLRPAGFLSLACLALAPAAHAAERLVGTDDELRSALRALAPGDTLRIAPGDYRGGWHLAGIDGGVAGIRITASDPARPPRMTGGGAAAWHLSGCRRIHLAGMVIDGFPANGINIDDAGRRETPAEGIRLEGVVIRRTGPKGNRDALKLSGLRDFEVRDCRFEGWGGSAVDMVGCHDGRISGCTFVGLEGFAQSNGVQAKGGSSNVRIEGNTFRNAGQRAVNLGGSTGLDYFRPPDATIEAHDIVVAGNRILGSDCAVALVSSRRGHVVGNTIVHPDRWVFRLLKENVMEGFDAGGDHRIEENLVVYDSRTRALVNVGPGTDPESLTFRRNAWFRSDGPTGPPDLPGTVTGSVLGVDPRLEFDDETGRPHARTSDPRLQGIGSDAWRAPEDRP